MIDGQVFLSGGQGHHSLRSAKGRPASFMDRDPFEITAPRPKIWISQTKQRQILDCDIPEEVSHWRMNPAQPGRLRDFESAGFSSMSSASLLRQVRLQLQAGWMW